MVTDIHSGKCTASITEHQGSAASITDIFVTEDSISVGYIILVFTSISTHSIVSLSGTRFGCSFISFDAYKQP